MTDHRLEVLGAAEHNLRDVDVTFGPGLTAVVGVSGSGKSSLVFDVVYAEARRRFVETLALGRTSTRVPAADVRSISVLRPAVSIAQNVLNLNPASTVATSVGLHPFLRILYARCADVSCPRCETPVHAVSAEQRLAIALELLERAATLDVKVALVHARPDSHRRLLDGLGGEFDRVTVDGRTWGTRSELPDLDPEAPHDIVVTVATLGHGESAANVRAALERADALGTPEVRLGDMPVLRVPLCPTCGTWVRPLEPAMFRAGAADTSSHRIKNLTLSDLMSWSIDEVIGFVEELPIGSRARRIQEELLRRLHPLRTLGLGYLGLDRSMPTLSRGEAQRTRLAVVLAGRLEELLHVLDEPTIGLHPTDCEVLLDAIAGLPGPVLMVEHDAAAVAMADDVVEIGPSGGRSGGRLVFQGTPAKLWRADTASGRSFSSTRKAASGSTVSDERITITGARLRNLRDVSIEIPLGSLTTITGPSGAGKTTLARDVLLASIQQHSPVACMSFKGPRIHAIAVDQAPLGKNPRSNPATYTKVFDRIREVFASATGRPASEFSFNRTEGACPECDGMGAIEIKLHYVAPVWVACEMCQGQRFQPEVLAATWNGLSIAEALSASVDKARELFADHEPVTRILDTLHEVGLGYLTLGQPAPSLSGGEAQRVRLAREVTRAKSDDLVLLDEPTTGLHPTDLDQLMKMLRRLTGNGCTVVVVEHQADVIASADWIVALGPEGGPDGGQVLHCGPGADPTQRRIRPRTKARRSSRSSDTIRVRGARAHNLRDLDVDFAKGRFTAVTGVSGSGKSSLVNDVLAAEANRRLLECLSVYERQSVREGPEAPVDSISGLGPTMTIDATSSVSDTSRPDLLIAEASRATVGRSSDLDRLVAVVLARAGIRTCSTCGSDRVRRTSPAPDAAWICDDCTSTAIPIEARHLIGSPAAICPECVGSGVIRAYDVDRVTDDPGASLSGGCFGGRLGTLVGYLCRTADGGVRSFGARHGFDPSATPWSELDANTRREFMAGDGTWIGMNYWAQFDLVGAETTASPCPECGGQRLRPPYLTLRLQGRDRNELFSSSLDDLADLLSSLTEPSDRSAADAWTVALRRLKFLRAVGLGYLNLGRTTWTLSAGEAQRIKLASLLGSELVGTTVLLDEPSRGLHPAEVGALAEILAEVRDAGNTVIAVEHDPVLIGAADDVIELGPGPGRAGGQIVESGHADRTGRTRLEGRKPPGREPTGWLTITGARENNLRNLDVRIPLGTRVGVCGPSGSGKSSLIVDTVALGLTPPKTGGPGSGLTRVRAGEHDELAGAPARTVVSDQSRTVVTSPGMFLGLVDAIRKASASGEAAVDQGLTVKDFAYRCDGCRGRGTWQENMSFLPAVTQTCDACGGSGYRREIASLTQRGRTLADIERLTLAELVDEWGDIDVVRRAGGAAITLGLGYLVVRQPGWSLSGGEAQRLKLAKELARASRASTLYVLDEPTVGLHVSDVMVLAKALDAVVDAGHTVLVVEHDPVLLATCDWLIELGPGAGPDGGRIVFEGRPEELAKAGTATAPYLREVLG